MSKYSFLNRSLFFINVNYLNNSAIRDAWNMHFITVMDINRLQDSIPHHAEWKKSHGLCNCFLGCGCTDQRSSPGQTEPGSLRCYKVRSTCFQYNSFITLSHWLSSVKLTGFFLEPATGPYILSQMNPVHILSPLWDVNTIIPSMFRSLKWWCLPFQFSG